MKAVLLIFYMIVCLVPTSIRAETELEVTSVIVDMDAAPDDFAAIVYLLKHPQISVRAITVSCGVSYVDAGATNTLRILDYLGHQDIPVGAGKDTPLIADHAFPTSWRESSNGFYGLELPETDLQPSSMNASDLIISTINSSGENVTLVTLGPLTNVAIALQTEPAIKDKINHIQIMGGAINAPGNVGLESDIPNSVAEWNIYIDPHAADIVFNSGVPIFLVALDATNEVPQTDAFLTKLESVMVTPEALLIYNMTTPGLYFWDQLTTVALTNESVISLEMHCIEVITDMENHEGWTNSTDDECKNVQVAMHANASMFEDIFIEIINAKEFTASTTQSTITTYTVTNGPFPYSMLIVILSIGSVAVVVLIAILLKRKL